MNRDSHLFFRTVSAAEIDDICELERESYPDDEAATHDMLVYRQSVAPELLMACFLLNELVGFVCATRYHGRSLKHESMKMHIPDGESICIHSVVVRQKYQRQGLGLRLLNEFVKKIKNDQKGVSRILLICKSNLIPLYTKAGFILKGESAVVHGKDPWYELQMDVKDKSQT